jgi:hypothetical protein
MKLEFSQFFEKYSNIKFRENPSSAVRTDGRKHLTKLIVAFRNFANAPNTVAYLRQPVTVPEFNVFVNAP